MATLIEGRDQKKRPTEFTLNQVLQPFVSEKFNFTKVSPLEVIFRFNDTKKDSAQYFDGVPGTVSASSSAILINVSARTPPPPTPSSFSNLHNALLIEIRHDLINIFVIFRVTGESNWVLPCPFDSQDPGLFTAKD